MFSRPAAHAILVVSLSVATNAARAVADWPLAGNPICVAPCDQVVTSTVSDGSGGMYLA